jgi:hypothetical protein
VSLSICCLTADPRRAAATLCRLRQVADEIVVAVDVTGGERDLTALGAVADCVFEVELDAFLESALTWLHAQCGADWILRVDDDEIVGADLLEQLPQLTRARDVVQYWLARRWLYPDRAHWLEQWPWFPDFQGRLVRNDGRLWFPGLCHSSVAIAGPVRYLDSGLYHLAHLLADRHERERKVERYRALDASLRVTSVDPYLASYYVPERHHGLSRAAVDPRDRPAIDALLAPADAHSPLPPVASASCSASASRSPSASRARRVTRAEVQSRWAERDFDAAGYRARIEPVDVYRRLLAGDHRPFRVCVHNDGGEWWPGGEQRRPLIRASYRWLTPDRAPLEQEGHRTALPHPLAPGESCLVELAVTAPAIPGRYLLAADLVHEHVRWFQCDAPPLEMAVVAPEAAAR